MKTYLRALFLLALAAWSLVRPLGAEEPAAVGPRDDRRGVAAEIEKLIEHEMADKELPALSIALVDEEEVVWARGFGMADPPKRIPATARTVYRVGSVSKLFTDLAIMRLVEAGKLDLDHPLEEYLPELKPRNPFGKPITLRQLLSHRAGLVREPPVGHYFDPTGPTLAETVLSLNSTELVYAPETRAKYSNAGIAVAGYLLERTQGRPYADYLEETVLKPLGLAGSGLRASAELKPLLSKAVMWTCDGRVFPAPTFELGTTPAGNLYSSVLDLSRFLSALFAGGRGRGGQIVKPETLAQMWTPQFAGERKGSGFGLGFLISELEGRKRVGHSGAVYGFATELAGLPELKLGVAVVIAKDVANAVARRIADHALTLMARARDGMPLPALELTGPLEPGAARRLAGFYRGDGEEIELIERGGKLSMARRGPPLAVRSLGGELVVDDAISYGPRFKVGAGGSLEVEKAVLKRVEPPKPAPAPERWRGLIGEYGWDHNTLYILEKEGKLQALIEWFFLYPLTELSPDLFSFPDDGLYQGEKLTFRRDGAGRAVQVEAASVLWKRRAVAGEGGETFRIRPLKPVEVLRRESLAASPPVEEGERAPRELVELSTLDPTLKFDIRYASTNNFLGTVLYSEPRAFLEKSAAQVLLRAHRELKPYGYGLLIHDGYRPWHVTRMFWEATPEEMRIFVADPAKGSRHNRGAAVDLTLYDLATGKPVPMVSGYDEFSPRAYPGYPGGSSLERWNRELLRRVMETQGFEVYTFEWWHFDFEGWKRFPILNLTFEELRKGQKG